MVLPHDEVQTSLLALYSVKEASSNMVWSTLAGNTHLINKGYLFYIRFYLYKYLSTESIFQYNVKSIHGKVSRTLSHIKLIFYCIIK